MLIDKEELDEYKLKIRTIASFKEEANDYEKKSVISGMIAGASTILTLNELVAFSGGEYNSVIHFFGIIGYSLLAAMGIYYNSIMKDKQNDCEEAILNLKKDLDKTIK